MLLTRQQMKSPTVRETGALGRLFSKFHLFTKDFGNTRPVTPVLAGVRFLGKVEEGRCQLDSEEEGRSVPRKNIAVGCQPDFVVLQLLSLYVCLPRLTKREIKGGFAVGQHRFEGQRTSDQCFLKRSRTGHPN